jgi:uncharacterized protein (DUF736 family)
MANDYDNNNKGAAFAPFDTQKLILQGKVNSDGIDHKVTLIKDQTRDGKTIIEVYEKIGTLFENDKKGNENAPDYTGPFNEFKRLAAWRRMKDNKPYMTFSVSDKSDRQQSSRVDDDVIPF